MTRILSNSICKILIICFFAMVIADKAYSAEGKVYYVSVEGNDAWSGSEPRANPDGKAGPFRSLEKVAGLLKAGDSCYILEGVYRERMDLQIHGEAGKPIVITAYRQDKVQINGCDPLDGTWTKESGGILKTRTVKGLEGLMVYSGGKLMSPARWPNASGDLMKPVYAIVDNGTYLSMTDNELPTHLSLEECTIEGFFGKEWAMQRMPVSKVDKETGTLYFPEPEKRRNYYGGNENWYKNYGPRSENRYYLTGSAGLLDKEGEFYYDPGTGELSIIPFSGEKAELNTIEIKARKYAINFSRCSWIELRGIDVFGAGVFMDSLTNNCILRDMEAIQVDPGFFVNGEYNEVNSCEVSYCANGLIIVGGTGHRIINNYIHDGNYSGSWDQLLITTGEKHLVSHNTISRAGGGCIAPGGINSRFQYNEVSDAGLIRHDIGGFYIGNHDGGYSVIDHNLVHNVYGIGIYLDNSSSKYLIHHNVVWNCGWEFVLDDPPADHLSISSYDGIRLNTPSNFSLVYHNTCYGKGGFGYWGRNFIRNMHGDYVINNIFTGLIRVTEEAVMSNNLTGEKDHGLKDPGRQDFTLKKSSAAIDAAVDLGIINNTFKGAAPDCGAYEYGEDKWRAGHNFDNPPDAEFYEISPMYMNLIKNGGFESGDLSDWTLKDGQFNIVMEDSWGIETAKTRMQRYALELGPGAARMEQSVDGLKPRGRYVFSGWFRLSNPADPVVIELQFPGGGVKRISVDTEKWTFFKIEFENNSTADKEVLSLVKVSSDSAVIFCDDIGLNEVFID